MPRCQKLAPASPWAGSAVFALALCLSSLSFTATQALAQSATAASAPASAASKPPPPPLQADPNLIVPLQISRTFPTTALRGELVLTQPPEVTLNGKTARLAPGARIRGENNMLVMWGMLIGKKLKVHYTIDTYGLLMDVWILRPDELAQLWPATPAEAAKWTYDPLKKTWSK
jgi:hypothetical protein